jgi:hypothetical protein
MRRTLAVLLALASIAATRFPVRNFPQAERLGRDLDRLDLGVARAIVEEGTYDLRLEGSGWKAWLPLNTGALGGTVIWTADLDRNGRRDLAIYLWNSLNGRCVNHGELATFMFDEAGRSNPSMIHTDFSFDPKNAGLVDLNGNGRAELAARECEYDPTTSGRSLQIRGIYEAQNGRWAPLRDIKTEPYRKLVPTVDRSRDAPWNVTPSAFWPDQLRPAADGKVVRIESLLDKTCPVIKLEVVNGRIAPANMDDCAKHARYSDGRTRKGWPLVMWDTDHGREIYMSNPEAALRELVRQKREVRLTGDEDEPSWIWAEGSAPAMAAK